jgi:uncharacterized membrane protein YoaK (UPF0700 family)
MEQERKIWYVTILLTVVAGYCDTVTFVAADNIFSAHVTGNFIVFAYQIVKGSDLNAWVKLLTFPVFILSVITGAWIAGKAANHHKILLWEGLMLIAGGIIAFIFKLYNAPAAPWPMYTVTMMVVFALGLQNAFGKLFAKETYGPTTMMTGNVTQASLDIGNMVLGRFRDLATWQGFKKQLVTIGGFLAGCLLGAFLGKIIGLTAVLLPGIAMITCYFITDTDQ